MSVAWFRAVWQKVTSSCSVRGGWDEEGREGVEGWVVREGEERNGRRKRKGRVK